MGGGKPTLLNEVSTRHFLSLLSLNPYTSPVKPASGPSPFTGENISIRRSQVICSGPQRQKAQEAGFPYWSSYRTCSQSSRPHSPQAKSKKQTKLTYGVGNQDSGYLCGGRRKGDGEKVQGGFWSFPWPWPGGAHTSEWIPFVIVELYIYAFCLTVYFNGNVYLFAYLLL